MQSNFYIFDPAHLHEISQNAVSRYGNDTQLIFDDILQQLHANPKLKPTLNKHSVYDSWEWMFNNAGGAMGSMYIIHASITEVRDCAESFEKQRAAHRPTLSRRST